MAAWIPITIAAAFIQNLRFMLQKHLKATKLSTGGATFARFIYGAPLAVVLVLIYAAVSGQSLPTPGLEFWAFALSGGIAQILATVCVVALFGLRNFAVGMTLKNTETIQTALAGFLVLGEGLSAVGLLAIAIGFVGLGFLGDAGREAGSWKERIDGRSVVLGLLSGALFAVSAIGYRGASLSLPSGDVLLRASTTLALVILVQSAIMAAWLWLREPGQMTRVFGAWKVASLVGLTSMLGSLGWFTAFTLTTAAYVRAVGQIELIFSYLASIFFFGERPSSRESIGLALLLVSIVLIIVAL